jgi:AraC family transcriptional regulator
VSLVGKSLWFIETRLSEAFTLNDVAGWVSVTPFHLARTFATATGQSLMRYVWRRRLTRAAQALVGGRDTVLSIALDAGYASPEAFTRAFRAEFGLSPSALRKRGWTHDLILTNPLLMRSEMTSLFAAPKIEVMPVRHFAGPVQRYDMQTRAGIPAQWAAYNEVGLRVEGAVPGDYYGLVFNYSEDGGTFDYMCGQEVSAGAALPAGFGSTSIEGTYARFATKGHISTMSAAWGEIFGDWLTRPQFRPRPGASVEYYPPEFDGMSGEGGYEIWVAVEG